ncbi:BON domain-containing protein [Pseudodesulfovibrio sp.]|uniref:BON domain-containing protein n=1 Tax=Pseudodesulfovibrio sp. TaxID=2035812 RepID=UPI002616E6D4|nr:BON domain-containing protein [Pseudodesulfovibrio sp.]MDD3312558.1 BON domain-containing protein [Pseudodesulfovibrio sp.]
MKKLVVIIALLLAASFSGGCAVVPALVTTGASFAVPQVASVAISAASTVHKTVLIAADERNVDDMVADKVATIRAQASLLGESGADVEAQCLNGDIYVVGEYATPEDRDKVVASLQRIDGVRSVKGVLRPMPESLAAMVEPAVSDKHAEMVIEAGLIKELNIKSANVDVAVLQGEAVITGVVENDAEADAMVSLVRRLRPRTARPVRITSLLAVQDDFERGDRQANDTFVLLTEAQMLAAAKAPVMAALATPAPVLPESARADGAPAGPGLASTEAGMIDTADLGADASSPSLAELASERIPDRMTPWQRARLKMKRRIAELAKAEADPLVKRRLITLSTRVLKDKNTSIEARLVKTFHRTPNLRLKHLVNGILADYAPGSAVPIQTVAMY